MRISRSQSLAERIAAMQRALTADELAALLNVSRLTILRRPKRGSIPSFRVGSCVRFDPANIAEWLVKMGVQRESIGALNGRLKVGGTAGSVVNSLCEKESRLLRS